ncbi:hypothetical protein [Nocardioides jensenii]|uniref:hypothetical protein n=1 Tax=Nocardioides jensenii TaxID=1843 RepID=UPI000829CDD9|nr:hypothetical protein [Nocardioides jensenii]
MELDSLLTSWIVEALGVSGRTASPLLVAKGVWARHEEDLRSTGDLLFTWQVDLRAAAEAMVADGRLTVEPDGRWTLPEGTAVPLVARRTWGEGEIATVVEGYVEMLRAEHEGRPVHRREVVADLTVRTGRSGDQLERMLSNISAVVQEHGIAPLASCAPRSNVPVGVRPAVAAALDL